MAVSLKQFIKKLEDTGIIPGRTLTGFLPFNASSKDAQKLARDLVLKKQLTKFQAEAVYYGHADSLLLGNYLLIGKVGEGGMGRVFKARHRLMERVVAIKLLKNNDRETLVRFEREVKAIAKIDHPNIVGVFDADCTEDAHYIVMEFVDGGDLFSIVKKNGPLSVEQGLTYILQAAKGLEAAHAAGIIHRDIKPANLLLSKSGIVKIIDLGIARLIEAPEVPDQTDLTLHGAIMGSLNFMAPEQALDSKMADARADIYALGCSLFYLLTAKAIYPDESPAKKILAHREHPIPSLREAGVDVTEPVEAVFTKMIAKNVEDRYQSMTDVIAALEGFVDLQEPPVSNPELLDSSPEIDLADFLDPSSSAQSAAALAEHLTVLPRIKPPRKTGKSRRVLLGVGAGGVLILLAALALTLKTKTGTLVVTVNEPDAEVQVLNEEGTVETTSQAINGPLTISIDPGKHQLNVGKEGFVLFSQDFEIAAGGKQFLTAQLIPQKQEAAEEVAVAETKPVPVSSPPTTPAPVAPNSTAPNPVVPVTKELAFESPDFRQWIKQVSSLTAEKQLEAVLSKLQELNPEFDGKATHKITAGEVAELNFSTDHVTDISPLRVLLGLKSLSCQGSGTNVRTGRLRDLSPLKGMQIDLLDIRFNPQVSDLSPLKNMPLTRFNCTKTSVADVSPLKGMKLRSFSLRGTPVSDLEPLTGMPLAVLEISNTRVTDLTPLQGLPLKKLDCNNTDLEDLSPLKEIKLNDLFLGNTKVTDLTPLNGMPLVSLTLYNTKVSDLSPLEGMKLRLMDGRQTRVSDLTPLKGMPLINLNVGSTQVSDLEPLAGMRLTFLGISRTRVTDLSPLQGMPLTRLECYNTNVDDLSPLEGMELKKLWLTPVNVTKGIDVIRQISTLTSISGETDGGMKDFSPDAFWKKYDAGEFGEPATPAK